MADVRDAATWPLFAEADPEYVAALAEMGGAPNLAAFPTVQALREEMEASKRAEAESSDAFPGVKQEDRQITMRDGHKITVRIYTPENKPSEGRPLGVVFHGGGWCIGGLLNEQPLSRLLASTYNMVIVNVDYRLGPEHTFPTGQFDGYDATKWAAENASTLGADLSRGFTIHGTSAGGNITSTVSHLWRDNRMSPPLTGVHLMVPALCDSASFPEALKPDWKSHADLFDRQDVILNRDAHNFFLTNYIPEIADRANPLFSPLLYDHAGLPPHFLQIAGMDPFRDEELIFERLLREQHGIATRVRVYQGVPHGFWSMFPHLTASKTFVQDSVAGVKWLLEQGSSGV